MSEIAVHGVFDNDVTGLVMATVSVFFPTKSLSGGTVVVTATGHSSCCYYSLPPPYSTKSIDVPLSSCVTMVMAMPPMRREYVTGTDLLIGKNIFERTLEHSLRVSLHRRIVVGHVLVYKRVILTKHLLVGHRPLRSGVGGVRDVACPEE